MTSALWLRNLIAFGIQSTVIVAVGALLLRVFRVRQPRAALAYWRVLLLACLLLPVGQAWKVAPVPPGRHAEVIAPAHEEANAPSTIGSVSGRARPSTETIVAFVIAGGIAVRALWLLAGAWTLARIRREATAIDPLPDAIERAQELVGTRAGHYFSPNVSGPITFGLRRPVVVFPPSLTNFDTSVVQAIACHELLHVRRRDWLTQIGEELLRTALWFHPAMWWIIGRIQLCREQVVDQAAVRLLASRERYVEALLAMALAKSPGILRPAPAFLRRSLLKKRVAQILQENIMTTRRLMVWLVASAGVLALATSATVRWFPLQAQERSRAGSSAPVQIVKGGDHLLHGDIPEYPGRAIEAKVEGDVLLDVAVDDRGEVSDARVLTGPDELRKASLEAVLGWHYAPEFVRSSSTQATLRFHLPPPNAEFKGSNDALATREMDNGELMAAQKIERLMMKLNQELKDSKVTGGERVELEHQLDEAKSDLDGIRAEREGALTAENKLRYKVMRDGSSVTRERSNQPLRLASVRTERVSDEAAKEVLQRAGVKVGDPVTEDVLKRVRSAAADIDEHFSIGVVDDGRGGITLTILSR